LSLQVITPGSDTADCVTHAFRSDGRTWAAYLSDCRSWQPKDIYLYYVILANHGSAAVPFHLRQFAAVAVNSATFGPVNVRDEATSPPSFLPETGSILPGAKLSGWLTFDGRLDFVPKSVSYVDSGQVLTIVFDGKHVIAPR
jgi:hypothetical protein